MPNDFWHDLDDGVLPADVFEKKQTKSVKKGKILIDLGVDNFRSNNFKLTSKKSSFTAKEPSPKRQSLPKDSGSSEWYLRFRSLVLKLMWSSAIVLTFGLVFVSGFKYFGKESLGRKVAFWNLFKNGKYLVLFQNNTELRASGGFLGSFAVVDLEDGKIKNIYFDTNIYKRDHNFVWTQGNHLEPPSPIKEAFGEENYFAMRDSNWDVDFPTTAQKVAWFYGKEGGEPVDGVIALNTTVMIDLLKLTGPIDLPQYNLTVDSNNFLSQIQYQVEKGYFEKMDGELTNEPKTVLKDMFPLLINKIDNYSDKKQFIELMSKELREKQIMFYFDNSDLEKIVFQENWGGKVAEEKIGQDYLYINHSNLGVNKSSLSVDQSVFYSLQKQNSTIVANLGIVREHKGSYNWPDGDNLNWTRILVPNGSRLISANENGKDVTSQIKVETEANKTVFAFWYKTKVGEKNSINLKYELPFGLENVNDYKLILQKQSGTLNDIYKVQFMDKILFNGVLNTDETVSFEQ